MKIWLHADDFGRSPAISRNILDVIYNGLIGSVSVMVDEVSDEHIELKNIKDLKIKLHLNLTEKKFLIKKNNKNIEKQFNFLTLFFASRKWKVAIKKEINKQIKTYITLFELNELRVDGHEHAHIVPWIYSYIINQKQVEVVEIRYPDEDIFYVNNRVLSMGHFYRNLFLLLSVKFLFKIKKHKKINPPIFHGLLYSSLYDEEVLKKNIERCKSLNKDVEILLHPGQTKFSERKNFDKKYFDFYISNQRNIEKDILKNSN